jgi:hypothetical protein
MPLAQSAPVEQFVFGSTPPDSHTPFVHLPLRHALASEHDAPGCEPPVPGLPVPGLPVPDGASWHTPAVQI